VLLRRLTAYRDQTAPLIVYYRQHGLLRTVDGMAAVPEVARHIEAALAGGKATAAAPIGKKSKARGATTRRKPIGASRKGPVQRSKAKAKNRPKSKAKSRLKSKAKSGVKTKSKSKAGARKRRR
jgi:adenylate kinase